MLVSQDYDNILNLIYTAECERDVRRLRGYLLIAMEEIFHAHSGAFFISDWDFRQLDLTDIVTHNIAGSACYRYAQYYWQLDPMYPRMMALTESVSKNSDVIPEPCWLKLEYYNDFQRPLDEHWELDIYLRSGADFYGWISLFRSKRQPNFDERDTLTAKISAPIMTLILRNAVLFSRAEKERSLLQNIIKSSPEGVIILDPELRPIYCNRKAQEIVSCMFDRQRDQVHMVNGRELPIPLDIVQNCLRLKRLSGNGNQTNDVRHQVTVQSKEKRIFRIELFVFRYPFEVCRTPSFFISLRELPETDNAGKGSSGEGSLMTRREMQVVKYVAYGLTNKQIANRLSISEFTVQTHLRNIFDKTGYRNRTQVASHVLPPQNSD